ncbi:hypothetical protein ACGFZB_02605 [Streptomyces cinerochromogenes]|uniref:Uncharacterized protein n=1 Tax=Streptomyces cinerochromogenes TaxID=66422 RepID=A0ABW7AWU0_9ACTN
MTQLPYTVYFAPSLLKHSTTARYLCEVGLLVYPHLVFPMVLPFDFHSLHLGTDAASADSVPSTPDINATPTKPATAAILTARIFPPPLSDRRNAPAIRPFVITDFRHSIIARTSYARRFLNSFRGGLRALTETRKREHTMGVESTSPGIDRAEARTLSPGAAGHAG